MLRTILLAPFFLLVLALDAQSPPAAADYLAGVKMRNVGPFRGGRANAARRRRALDGRLRAAVRRACH
jgi:hypothetical protein